MDEFAMVDENYEKTVLLVNHTFVLLASLGLKRHPTKEHFLPIPVGDYQDMILYFQKGEFRAPTI
jgi:hypothetical protein